MKWVWGMGVWRVGVEGSKDEVWNLVVTFQC